MSPANIRYINQSAPFWDWIASFEDQASEHPMFNGQAPRGPWQNHAPWFGHFAHRGGPPPPPQQAEASSANQQQPTDTNEKAREGDDNIPDPPEETPQPSHPHEGGWGRRGRGCGPRRGRGGWHGGHHPYARHGWPMHNAGGFAFLSDLFGGAPGANNESSEDAANDFKPDADVFDTKASFVVHLSLPGAHKEDIGVSWDPEKSELTVAGVVHRPGDEEFLKALALDERKVGAFERKVRLGTRSNPAQVDVEGITARLDNGILVVEVPKLNADFVEIRKVDIE